MKFKRKYQQTSYGEITVEAKDKFDAQEKYENEKYEDECTNMEDKEFEGEWNE